MLKMTESKEENMLKEKAVSIIQAKASRRSSRRPSANRFLVDFW